MCVNVFPVCVYVCAHPTMHAHFLKGSEEGIRGPGTGITDS